MSEKGAPTWRYVGQLGAIDSQLGSILGTILAHLGHLKANVNQNGEKAKNIEKLMVFKGFWVVRGVHLEPFGDHVGLCWRILALRSSILSELGNMMQHVATS